MNSWNEDIKRELSERIQEEIEREESMRDFPLAAYPAVGMSDEPGKRLEVKQVENGFIVQVTAFKIHREPAIAGQMAGPFMAAGKKIFEQMTSQADDPVMARIKAEEDSSPRIELPKFPEFEEHKIPTIETFVYSTLNEVVDKMQEYFAN